MDPLLDTLNSTFSDDADVVRNDPDYKRYIPPSRWSTYKGGVMAKVTEGPGIYYLGIIDMLQKWSWETWMRRWLRIIFKREDPKGISPIEPKAYQKRFMDKMEEIIQNDEDFFSLQEIRVADF